ncbi:MAG: hypothetical protein V4536_02010 [Pseudomonadota bacterium]
MSKHDPIFITFKIYFFRIIWFFGISALLAFSVWSWALIHLFGIAFWDLFGHLTWEFLPHIKIIEPLLVWCSMVIGVLATSLIFSLIHIWWHQRGDQYRRGSNLGNKGA